MKRFVRGTFAIALIVGCGGSITDTSASDRVGGVVSVIVTTTGNHGTPAMPLPFSNDGVTFTTRIEVRGANNARLTNFNGWLALSVAPGDFQGVTGPDGAVLGNLVKLTAGVGDGFQVTVARGYGEARIWAEEQGYIPVDPRRSPAPQCSNGLDDDHDGLIDYPSDPGCFAANDDSERAGSYVIGTSEPIYFDLPNIIDVRGRSAVSPLLGDRITVRGRITPDAPAASDRVHRLVVTQTNTQGFYVTDIDDTSCMGQPCFNSLYSFNFNTPVGMRPCDLVDTLTGSVAQFVGTTQLTQPGFHVGMQWFPNDPVSGQCLSPDAVEVTAAMLGTAATMEQYQSSVARVTNVTLPTLIGPGRAPMGIPMPGATNCDLNGDGAVTYTNGNLEGQCSNACTADPTCSEWTNWLRYGQITVTFAGAAANAPRISVAARTVNANFDPTRPRGPVATVTGNLQQVGSAWIVLPRCGADFVVQGDGQTLCEHPRDCCLHERSAGDTE